MIRGWLGQAELSTTNRYAEINTRAKLDELRATDLGRILLPDSSSQP